MATAARSRRPARTRLAPEDRRRQLVAAAAHLLGTRGAAHVEILAVAEAVGVTRPVVYRFFPTRLALVQAVMDDFVTKLTARFHAALASTMGGSLPEMVRAFVLACADAIEAEGAGPWQLFYARGPDAAAAQLGRAALQRLLEPWLPRVAQLTGLSRARVHLHAEIVVAAGGAALDGWLAGPLGRREAVALATRSVSALLDEFARASSRAREVD